MKNKYITLLFSTALIVSLSSCLKDDNVEDGLYGFTSDMLETNKLVEIPILNHVFNSTTFPTSDGFQEIELFTIRLASKDPSSTPVTVKIEVNHDKKAFAKQFGTGDKPFKMDKYKLLEASLLEVPATVVIPAGEREVTVKAKVKASQLSFDPQWINFQLIEASEGYKPSGNFGNVLVSFNQKNEFSANYEFTFIEKSIFNNAVGNALKAFNGEKLFFKTVNENTIETDAFPGVWNDPIQITFDLETKEIIETHVTTWDVFSVDKSRTSYDPSTKTYKLTIIAQGNPKSYITYQYKRVD